MYLKGRHFSLHRQAWYALAGGAAFSLALFFWFFDKEHQVAQAHFDKRAQFRAMALEQGIDNVVNALEDVHRLFVANGGQVSRQQFHSFTEPLRLRFPYIEAFAYHRVLTAPERGGYETAMRARHAGFAIADLVDGQRVVAPARERYHVVDYLEPMAGNEKVFGMDTGPRPFHGVAIRAAASGEPAASGLFTLLGGKGMQRGFLILKPVYRGGALPASGERQEATLGYTVVVLRADDLIAKVMASAAAAQGNGDLDIRVYAANGPDQGKLAYASRPEQGDNGSLPGWLQFPFKPYIHTFQAAGAPWHLVVESRHPILDDGHTHALLALLAGLLATLAATVWQQTAATRAQLVQVLVEQRTEQLRHANERLNADIETRRQVEQALIAAEQRARDMADLSSDWYWEQDEHFRYVNLSIDVGMQGVMPPGATLPPGILGATRWELPVDMEASDWAAHRATLEAHLPFKDFEYRGTMPGLPIEWVSASGKPIFDASGNFKGYRGTARNITDRKRAEEALQRSRSQLRKLADYQEKVKEEERRRIARDIHDDLGQNLLALRIDVSMLASQRQKTAVTEQNLAHLLRQIDTSIQAVRHIINDLRPSVLDLGLHAAIEWQVREFERRSGIGCELIIDHDEFALDDQRTTSLFRIVQESLTNIMRHARATQVRIALLREAGRFVISISDDGVGMLSQHRRKGDSFGLVGIAERIHALGGELSIDSNPGQGMNMKLWIPV